MSSLETGRRAPFVLVPEWILLADISPQAKSLYMLLLAHTNTLRGDGLAWPGMDAMAAILGYRKRQSIGRYVRELERIGAVEVRVSKWEGGRRNTYVVHEVAPADYSGYVSVAAFHTHRDALRKGMRNPSPNPSAKGSSEGGSPPEGTMGSPLQGTRDGPPQGTRTRRTEPPEANQMNGTSSGGAHAMAQPGGRARITGAHLAKLEQPAIIQKLTSVWCAVVREHGGELPQQDTEGWGAEDTHVYTRGKHPIGSQIKTWVEENDLTPDALDSVLDQIREHAEQYATNQHRSAA